MENNKEKTIKKENFTEIIANEFMEVAERVGANVKPEELSAVKYFVNVNLNKIFGTNLVEAKDIEFISNRVSNNPRNKYKDNSEIDMAIELANQFTSPEVLRLEFETTWSCDEVKNEKEINELKDLKFNLVEEYTSHLQQTIFAYLGDELVFVINSGKKRVTNEVEYMEGEDFVTEEGVINFKGRGQEYDANRFYLSKYRNGALEFDGSLTSVFSNGIDGFDFHYGNDKNEEHASLIQWIAQVLATNQYITVGIADKKGKLVEYTSTIYNVLEQ